MAYYTALISAWNAGVTPSGVTGSALTGLTTAQKLININAWTVAGSAVVCDITPSQIINCIDTVAHLNALTTTQLAVMQFLAGSGQPILAAPGSLVRQWFQNAFAGQTTTLTNFAALVAQFDSPPVPWYSAPVSPGPGAGLTGPVNLNDLAAGGLT